MNSPIHLLENRQTRNNNNNKVKQKFSRSDIDFKHIRPIVPKIILIQAIQMICPLWIILRAFDILVDWDNIIPFLRFLLILFDTSKVLKISLNSFSNYKRTVFTLAWNIIHISNKMELNIKKKKEKKVTFFFFPFL